MKTQVSYSSTGKIGKSILFCLPMLLLTFMFITGGRTGFSNTVELVSFCLTFVFFNALFFLILYTGKTDRYRAIGFIAMAIFFALAFIVNLVKVRGSMTFSNNNLLSCEIPFCHIVSTMVIIPLVLTKSIIFPGSILNGFASIATMFVIVIGVSLALGRGFCSWGCFYGGWDEGSSRVLKKPIIKNFSPKWRWFSFAFLLIIALFSAITLSPKYCDWFCPFKAVTEFERVTTVQIFLKTVVFISLFLGLVIILPLLTKKRVQCGTFCPMGALMSFTNKINPFEVKINKDKCNDCKSCSRVCPTFSIGNSDSAKEGPEFTCTKCGKCIDSCTRGALYYHIKGTPDKKGFSAGRLLFLYPAFTLLVVFAGGNIMSGLVLIFKLVSTGSLL
jgi:ferredoxin-type protein NapH